MIAVLLWLLAGLLALVLVLLATPMRFRLVVRSAPAMRARVTVAAAGGLLPGIALYDSARASEETAAPPEPGRRKPRKSRRSGRTGAGPRVGKAAIRLLPDLVRRIHLDHFIADAAFGFDDPADTGLVFGLATPLLYGTAGHRKIEAKLRPDFSGAHFDGTLDTALHITPVALLPPALRFAWRAFGPGR